ncbi:unnamed protein product, partial [Rotaria sordida]
IESMHDGHAPIDDPQPMATSSSTPPAHLSFSHIYEKVIFGVTCTAGGVAIGIAICVAIGYFEYK